MSIWRQLTHGLRRLANRTTAEQDIADEVQHFLDRATEEGIARGLTAEEAGRAARLELGSPAGVREQVRDYGWENRIESLHADLLHAARRLRAAPAFCATAVLTLALGIGAATAIVSAVRSILLEPLPYPHPERIAAVWDRDADGTRVETTFGTYRELVTRARSFESLAVIKPWQPAWSGSAEPERLEGQSVSASYFRVLGVEPVLGRGFEEADDRPDSPRVVLLGDALWHRSFGGDPSVVGRSITLHGEPHLVIGVLPAGFEDALAPFAQLWSPLRYDLSMGSAWGHHLRMVGRLRSVVDRDDARQELDEIARGPRPELPRPAWASLDNGLLLTRLQDDLTRGSRPILLVLVGAVILLLAIACVNVTNLLLARSLDRRGELALRSALGAGRGRLVRQLLTEGLLVAALGGLGGVAVASLGLRAFVVLSPPGLPRLDAASLDARALFLGLGLTTLVGLACGLIPALQAARRDPHRDLSLSSRRGTSGRQGARRALVVIQVALALVLVIGAGLLVGSLGHLLAVDPGFEASQRLALQVETAGSRFDDPAATERYFGEVLAAVREVPGVAAAAFVSQLPLGGDSDRYGAHLETRPVEGSEGEGAAFRYAVSPGYLETLGIPLLRGRSLGEDDRADTPYVALVSESLARRRFAGTDPLGERLRIGPLDGPLYTIVGIAADVRQISLALDEAEAVYVPASQWRFADGARWFVLRSRGDAARLAPSVRRAIWSVDRDQPIVRVHTLEQLVAASASQQRFALILFSAFAFAALVLAAAGIYGVLAGSVAERKHEAGVRAALGATRVEILSLVMFQGLTLTAIGVALGIVGAMAATETLAALLFGISNLDPATYLGAIALLGAAAAAACAVPAWRAARVDPASTLRAE